MSSGRINHSTYHKHYDGSESDDEFEPMQQRPLYVASPPSPMRAVPSQSAVAAKPSIMRTIVPRTIAPVMSNSLRINNVYDPTPNVLKNRPSSYLTFRDTFKISWKTLFEQADGGKELEIKKNFGLGNPEYSNPVDGSPEMRKLGAIAVLAGENGHISQNNSLGIPLLMTVVGLPMPRGDNSTLANPSSVDVLKAPFGYLAHEIRSGEKKSVGRKLTTQMEAFLEKYPGQKHADQREFVTVVKSDPTKSHVVMQPEPAAIYFLRQLPEVQANPQILKDLANLDALNAAYAPTDIMNKAIEASEAIDRDIVYFDPDNISIKFGLPFENLLDNLGARKIQGNLAEAFRSHPEYKSYLQQKLSAQSSGSSPTKRNVSSTSASNNGVASKSGMASLTPIEREFIEKGHGITVSYEVKLPFYNVHPNFGYSENPV